MTWAPDVTVVAYRNSREDWHRSRAVSVTASNMACVCGRSKYKTAQQFFAEWNGDVEVAKQDWSKADWGNRLEPVVGAYLVEIGKPFVEAQELITSPRGLLSRGYIACTPDGYFDYDIPELVEIKTTSAAFSRNVSDEWLYQVQTQLLITGLQKGYVAALYRGNTFHLHQIDADADIQKEIIDASNDFVMGNPRTRTKSEKEGLGW